MNTQQIALLAGLVGSTFFSSDNLYAGNIFGSKNNDSNNTKTIDTIFDTVETVSGNSYQIISKNGAKRIGILGRETFFTIPINDSLINISLDDTLVDDDNYVINAYNISEKKIKTSKNIKNELQKDNNLKIIYLWATYCVSCRYSLPKLDKYREELNDFKDKFEMKHGFIIPGKISIYTLNTQPDESHKYVMNFIKEEVKTTKVKHLKVDNWSKHMDELLFPTDDRPLPMYIFVDGNCNIVKVGCAGSGSFYDDSFSEMFQMEVLRPYFQSLLKNK
jgi:thiol-disulfide isomerase/thioredoxin